MLLWLPYFLLFVFIFAVLFPMTNGGDDPNPATGLILLGMLVLYPFYIFLINWMSMFTKNPENVTDQSK
ncbi:MULTISPECIES: hypothetical protein [Paenibacillus]|uniref:hypothetical protein n=1 Tax=Paenibacillus TaxID=44249 RepID=UPI001F1D39C1|nr:MULTISPECIES: hypothetical protein [Paenibacillus]